MVSLADSTKQLSITLNFKDIYEGFQKTPLLWNANEILNLQQFSPIKTIDFFEENDDFKNLRLGKWVEQFIIYQLKKDSHIEILEENFQIKEGKITIGELDLLFLKDKEPCHLEIIYKFYLYDSTMASNDTLDYWIGPNRNDTLRYKLKKLKEKQLPLLYKCQTEPLILKHGIDLKTIKQRVCFKAQLFLPYNSQDITISPLNASCVSGCYISFDKINELKNFDFYIPSKLEWLSVPKLEVPWQSFKEAKQELKEFKESKRSPLCWLKGKDGSFQKCFITWW